MKQNSKKHGLAERLRAAASAEEITALLKEGATYAMASKPTRRRWKRLAERRAEFLSSPPKQEDPKSVPASDRKQAKPKPRSGK